jgi:hypothetical protein
VREDDNVTGIPESPQYCSTKYSVLNENATKINNFLVTLNAHSMGALNTMTMWQILLYTSFKILYYIRH